MHHSLVCIRRVASLKNSLVTGASDAFWISKCFAHTSVLGRGGQSAFLRVQACEKHKNALLSPHLCIWNGIFSIKLNADRRLSRQAYHQSRVIHPPRKLPLPLPFYMKMPASASSTCATAGSRKRCALFLL